MLHDKFKKSGVGKEVIAGFTDYVKDCGGKRIRIDVVPNYDETSIDFWRRLGFVTGKEVMLSWGEKKFLANKMLKVLN